MELYDITSDVRILYDLYESNQIDLDTYRDTIESLGTEKIVEDHIKMIRNSEANISIIEDEINKLHQKLDSEKKS